MFPPPAVRGSCRRISGACFAPRDRTLERSSSVFPLKHQFFILRNPVDVRMIHNLQLTIFPSTGGKNGTSRSERLKTHFMIERRTVFGSFTGINISNIATLSFRNFGPGTSTLQAIPVHVLRRVDAVAKAPSARRLHVRFTVFVRFLPLRVRCFIENVRFFPRNDSQ